MKLRPFFASLFVASALAQEAIKPSRPEKFARPLEIAGLPNLHRVTPNLFRSAQPLPEGFAALEKIGIRTVINLRNDLRDEEVAAGTKLKLVHVPMGFDGVDEAAVTRVLALLEKKEDGPFLVHCQMGVDRTGVVMAMWRRLTQRWSHDDAIAEMKDLGLNFQEFADYVETADLAKVKAKVEKAKSSAKDPQSTIQRPPTSP
jgi:protein tyrosine phosphatase (PTP) superfamily phosphohydrolase (DUF442 family)